MNLNLSLIVFLSALCIGWSDSSIAHVSTTGCSKDSMLEDKKEIEPQNYLWIYKYTHEYKKDGELYNNFEGTKIDLNEGFYRTEDKNGVLTITTRGNLHEINFEGIYLIRGSSKLSSHGSATMNLTNKKIYIKNGTLQIRNAENKVLITLCSHGEW